jgi:hypothetical protein
MEMSLKTLLISCAASVAIFRHEDNAVNYSLLSTGGGFHRYYTTRLLTRRLQIGLEHSRFDFRGSPTVREHLFDSRQHRADEHQS